MPSTGPHNSDSGHHGLDDSNKQSRNDRSLLGGYVPLWGTDGRLPLPEIDPAKDITKEIPDSAAREFVHNLRNLKDSSNFDYDWTKKSSHLQAFARLLADELPKEISPAIYIRKAIEIIRRLESAEANQDSIEAGKESSSKLIGLDSTQYNLLRGHFVALAEFAGGKVFGAAVGFVISSAQAVASVQMAEIVPSKDEIDKLLTFDALAEAEKFTGNSYKDSADTNNLGLDLLVNHVAAKKDALQRTNDSHLGISFENFEALALSLGFIPVLRENCSFQDQFSPETTREETVCIYYRPDGLLLFAESFGDTLNSAKAYGNWRSYDSTKGTNLHRYAGLSHICAGVRSMELDCREGFRRHLELLEQGGEFLSHWIKQPFLWLLQYNESKKPGYDREQINSSRIALLPPNVQEMITPNRTFVDASPDGLMTLGFHLLGKENFEYLELDYRKVHGEVAAFWNPDGILAIQSRNLNYSIIAPCYEGETGDPTIVHEIDPHYQTKMYCNWQPDSHGMRILRSIAGPTASISSDQSVLVDCSVGQHFEYHLQEMRAFGKISEKWGTSPSIFSPLTDSETESLRTFRATQVHAIERATAVLIRGLPVYVKSRIFGESK